MSFFFSPRPCFYQEWISTAQISVAPQTGHWLVNIFIWGRHSACPPLLVITARFAPWLLDTINPGRCGTVAWRATVHHINWWPFCGKLGLPWQEAWGWHSLMLCYPSDPVSSFFCKGSFTLPLRLKTTTSVWNRPYFHMSFTLAWMSNNTHTRGKGCQKFCTSMNMVTVEEVVITNLLRKRQKRRQHYKQLLLDLL